MLEESICSYCIHLMTCGFKSEDDMDCIILRCPVLGSEVHEVKIDMCNYYERLGTEELQQRMDILALCS